MNIHPMTYHLFVIEQIAEKTEPSNHTTVSR